MTDNEKLARWQGWELDDSDDMCHVWITPEHRMKRNVPDYLNDDAAAMSLLDTLVEKGHEYNLCGNTRRVDCRIYKDDVGVCMSIKPTRHEAVVAAVLELIAKGA